MSASPTIFLSYARHDQRCAERLATVLSAKGLSVWWDRKIHAGRSYERVIEEALAQARIVVVLWSRFSVESDWVRAEASYALETNKLLPLNIDRTRLPLRFRPVQTISLTNWDKAQNTSEWALLFEEIDQRLGSSDEPVRLALEARAAEEARQRTELEAGEDDAARQQAERERAELETRKANEARCEAEQTQKASEAARADQLDADQLDSEGQKRGARDVPLAFIRSIEKGYRRKPTKSKILQISIVIFAVAIPISLALVKSDYASRWAMALRGAMAPATHSLSLPMFGAVTATHSAPEPVKPIPNAQPFEAALSNPPSEPAVPAPSAPPATTRPTPNVLSEPATLPPVAPPSEIASDNSAPKAVAPLPPPASGEVGMAMTGSAPASAPKPELTAPAAEIAPVGTNFRTVVPTVLREQPDKSARRLDVLKPGTWVVVVGKKTGSWYKVKVPSKAPSSASVGFVEVEAVREYVQGVSNPAASPITAPSQGNRVRRSSPEAVSGQCAAIIERSQLGEAISDADRAFLKSNCR
jgi:TIR domain